MNSKQRRQIKRHHPFSVTLSISPTLRYYEWDARVHEMRVWCNKYARKGWTVNVGWDTSEFSFNQEQVRTMFILRWSS